MNKESLTSSGSSQGKHDLLCSLERETWPVSAAQTAKKKTKRILLLYIDLNHNDASMEL